MIDPTIVEMIRPLVKRMTADERLELIRAILAMSKIPDKIE